MAGRETSYDDDHLCAEYEPIQDGDLDEPVEARLEDLSQQIKALEGVRHTRRRRRWRLRAPVV